MLSITDLPKAGNPAVCSPAILQQQDVVAEGASVAANEGGNAPQIPNYNSDDDDWLRAEAIARIEKLDGLELVARAFDGMRVALRLRIRGKLTPKERDVFEVATRVAVEERSFAQLADSLRDRMGLSDRNNLNPILSKLKRLGLVLLFGSGDKRQIIILPLAYPDLEDAAKPTAIYLAEDIENFKDRLRAATLQALSAQDNINLCSLLAETEVKTHLTPLSRGENSPQSEVENNLDHSVRGENPPQSEVSFHLEDVKNEVKTHLGEHPDLDPSLYCKSSSKEEDVEECVTKCCICNTRLTDCTCNSGEQSAAALDESEPADLPEPKPEPATKPGQTGQLFGAGAPKDARPPVDKSKHRVLLADAVKIFNRIAKTYPNVPGTQTPQKPHDAADLQHGLDAAVEYFADNLPGDFDDVGALQAALMEVAHETQAESDRKPLAKDKFWTKHIPFRIVLTSDKTRQRLMATLKPKLLKKSKPAAAKVNDGPIDPEWERRQWKGGAT
ncbi:MAG: hypothetical protein JXQ99_28380 [Hyphomicrobiaceae bacterium]